MSAAEGGSHGLDIRESPLVEMAAEAERPTRWWVGWIVMFGFGVIGINIIVSPLYTALAGSPAEGSPLFQVGEVFTNGATLVVLALWLRFKERRPFSSIGFRGRHAVGRSAIGFAAGVVLFAVPTLALVGMGQYADGRSTHTTSGTAAIGLAAALVLTFVVQATSEEAVTRGYLLPIGGLQLSSWLAVFVTSFLFAAAHMNFQPLVLLNITLYAVAASFVALGQGSLWLVCGFHIAWNWAQGNLFGIPVSGTARQVSVWTFGPASGSNDTLTGGDFGIEGSLAATVVLALVSVGSFVYYRRCAARRASTTTPVAG